MIMYNLSSSRIPAPFSRKSRIPHFFSLLSGIPFLFFGSSKLKKTNCCESQKLALLIEILK